MQQVDWTAVRRVLVVRLDNIGDVILTSPATLALRRALPEAEITLLASPAGTQALPLMPWIDDAITLRALWQDASGNLPFDPAREFGVVEDLARRRFDAAVIFTSFSQSPFPPAYACYLAGIPVRIAQAKEFGGGVLSHQAEPAPFECHQAERNIHVVESAGIPVENEHLVLRVPADAVTAAENLLDDAGIARGDAFVAVAPGASCPARRYDPPRFAEAARLITSERGLRVVALGSDRDREACELVARATNGANLAGKTSIPELAAVIQRSSLVICNDSGPMHIADAFARPQVVLYSGTELESQWRPRRSPHVLLRRETDCSPCYRFDCPHAMACLDIPAAEVADAANLLLGHGAETTEGALA